MCEILRVFQNLALCDKYHIQKIYILKLYKFQVYDYWTFSTTNSLRAEKLYLIVRTEYCRSVSNLYAYSKASYISKILSKIRRMYK